jgi:hypothetical protein
MKRISIFLAVCLAVLSFGLVNAQVSVGGEVPLVNASGLYNDGGVDKIGFGTSVTFDFAMDNNTGIDVHGSTNGFEIYTDNNAGYTLTVDVAKWETVMAAPIYDGGQFVNFFGGGGNPDTVGFGGFKIFGQGLLAGDVVQSISFTVDFGPESEGATQFCLDTAFYPPGGEWLWAMADASGRRAVCDWAGTCWDLIEIPNLPPVIDPAPPVTVTATHCETYQVTFTATDPDAEDDPPFIWNVIDGIGSFGPDNGSGSATWSYSPSAADVGASLFSTFEVCDHRGACSEYTVNFEFTNIGPSFTGGCGLLKEVGMGNTSTIQMTAVDGDCDPISFSITDVTPAPVGSYSINANTGLLTFNTEIADGGNTFDFTVRVTDEAGDFVECVTSFVVLVTQPFKVVIEKTHNSYIGLHEYVDITVEEGSELMGGFDFLIAYDASALTFNAAIPGEEFYAQPPVGCGWEYFTYRFGPQGNCGGPCPSGMLRVIGIAETNNGPNHPACFNPEFPAVLFTLDFRVSSDATLECQYVPIRFYWMDCGDNAISSKTGDTLFVNRNIVDFAFDDEDYWVYIQNKTTGYPTYTGIQEDCFVDLPEGKFPPAEFIDFFNGGIDIVCADSIDARGDLNLNEIPYEIADAVLFSNYFVYGLGVFHINLQGQIAASDVNADGITLSVADLVYLIRVICGDAFPTVKLSPVNTEYTVSGTTVSVADEMGAAYVVVAGDAAPQLMADGMEMKFNYDGQNTHVLVFSMDANTFQGEFLNAGGNVVSIEFGSPEGATVVAKGTTVPNTFELAQNYPNPFNPTTTIDVKSNGDFTLSIYNVTGQKVAEFSGNGNESVVWDANGQASGVYFYKLETENFSATKKMMLLK